MNQARVKVMLRYLLLCGVLMAMLPRRADTQPQIKTFAFPEAGEMHDWRLDLYFKLNADVLTQSSDSRSQPPSKAKVLIYDSADCLVAETTATLPPTDFENTLASQNSAIEGNKSLHLAADEYKLFFQIRDNNDKTILERKETLTLNKPSQVVELSDLVPVDLPRLGWPPFDEILWPEDDQPPFSFLLYYETYVANADTMIDLKSTLESEDGRIIKEESYALSVYGHKRHDFLRVDLDELQPGTYVAGLSVHGVQPEVSREFRFTKTAGGFNLNGAPLEEQVVGN